MFFSSRKKEKLAEEAQQKEQARLKQEAAIQEANAYSANLETFYRICDMVRSLPKKRQIVVVQRINIFKDNHERNQCYLNLAKEMRRYNRVLGSKWITFNDGSLYAFYAFAYFAQINVFY